MLPTPPKPSNDARRTRAQPLSAAERLGASVTDVTPAVSRSLKTNTNTLPYAEVLESNIWYVDTGCDHVFRTNIYIYILLPKRLFL